MLSLLRVARKPHHYIRLNASFTADLRWRHTFAMEWNGISMLYQLKRHSPDEEYFTDASGSWGCAAMWEGQWFQLEWLSVPSFATTSKAPKELLPVVLPAGTWGHIWAGKTILLPITPTILLSLRSELHKEPTNWNNIMLWVACCACFFSFLRSDEITIPSPKDYD